MSTERRFTALVMAGSRGAADPIVAGTDSSHKCLCDVYGAPMLVRVLEALEASESVQRIIISIEASAPLETVPGIAQRLSSGNCRRLDAADSPASSVLRALDTFPEALPCLVVTGDHPLLTSEMVDHFCRHAPARADVAVGLAPANTVLAAYPESVRTLLRFREGAYCGCNLYVLNTARARAAAQFWRRIELARKRPWRLIRELGVFALLRYWCGRLGLVETMQRASRAMDLAVTAVEMPFAEAAIDVDKPADLRLAERILKARDRNSGLQESTHAG